MKTREDRVAAAGGDTKTPLRHGEGRSGAGRVELIPWMSSKSMLKSLFPRATPMVPSTEVATVAFALGAVRFAPIFHPQSIGFIMGSMIKTSTVGVPS